MCARFQFPDYAQFVAQRIVFHRRKRNDMLRIFRTKWEIVRRERRLMHVHDNESPRTCTSCPASGTPCVLTGTDVIRLESPNWTMIVFLLSPSDKGDGARYDN